MPCVVGNFHSVCNLHDCSRCIVLGEVMAQVYTPREATRRVVDGGRSKSLDAHHDVFYFRLVLITGNAPVITTRAHALNYTQG